MKKGHIESNDKIKQEYHKFMETHESYAKEIFKESISRAALRYHGVIFVQAD